MVFSEKSGTRRGFTLIELLIVVSSLAILASMLMPSLQHARSFAREAACVGNLKTYGMYIQLYCDSSDGNIPVGRRQKWDSETGDSYKTLGYILHHSLFPEQGIRLGGAIKNANGVTVSTVAAAGPRSMSFFNCPENTTQTLAYGLGTASSNSYGVNLTGMGSLTTTYKLSDLKQPEKLYFIGEAYSVGLEPHKPSSAAENRYENMLYQSQIEYVHRQQSTNLLFGDGHVTNHAFGIFNRGSFVSGSFNNAAHWYPDSGSGTLD